MPAGFDTIAKTELKHKKRKLFFFQYLTTANIICDPSLSQNMSSFTAPGGTLSDDMTCTDFCLFKAQEDMETMQAYAQVIKVFLTPQCY